jgi:LPS-assembly protein
VDNTLAAESRPYKQLPEFTILAQPIERNKRLNVGARAEFVNFERRSSIKGFRWDIEPTVTFPIRSSAGFLVPSASLRYTGYALDDNAGTGIPDAPSRVLPRFSLDGGLFLERRFELAGQPMVQTLEPRIYYLFVPFDDQDDLPVFDTSEYTFSFAQLFRDDRFGSADRMADAHQVSLALTSRFLRPSDGDELFRASVGQIRYFRDRKVVLPGGQRDIDRTSDLVAEVSASFLEPWRLTAGVQWDPSNGRSDRNTISVRYQPDSRRVANFTYRFVRNSVEQTDVSAAWPLSRNWRAVGRWNYALPESRTLEAFAGVEYESCCWGFRTVVRRYLTNTRGDYNNAIFAQLQLKGLTGIGDAAEFLVKSIPGYRNEF